MIELVSIVLHHKITCLVLFYRFPDHLLTMTPFLGHDPPTETHCNTVERQNYHTSFRIRTVGRRASFSSSAPLWLSHETHCSTKASDMTTNKFQWNVRRHLCVCARAYRECAVRSQRVGKSPWLKSMHWHFEELPTDLDVPIGSKPLENKKNNIPPSLQESGEPGMLLLRHPGNERNTLDNLQPG